MVIAQLLANDTNGGYVTYGIRGVNGEFNDRDFNFRINPITGVLQASQVYDYERIKSYTVSKFIIMFLQFGFEKHNLMTM